MLSLVTFEPGSVVPDHAHPHEHMEDVSGKAEFTVDGVTKVLGPGDMLRIPEACSTASVPSIAPAVALDVFHPIREDYL